MAAVKRPAWGHCIGLEVGERDTTAGDDSARPTVSFYLCAPSGTPKWNYAAAFADTTDTGDVYSEVLRVVLDAACSRHRQSDLTQAEQAIWQFSETMCAAHDSPLSYGA